VALLHDGELLDAVPAEPHDHSVRAAITPGGGLIPLV
jgi:5-formyltetrahydrofolate cyclo-ligase